MKYQNLEFTVKCLIYAPAGAYVHAGAFALAIDFFIGFEIKRKI